jgi:rhamnulose-1-phosphate aldolase
MALEQPYPDLDELLALIGDAGQRLADINAIEGAAGNISVMIGWPLEVRRRFPMTSSLELPHAVPELAGARVIVTGSGRRLREVRAHPTANLGVVVVDEGGRTGTLHTAPERLFARVTSEFNSHLAVHQDEMHRTRTNFHAVIHAQPPYLTYLSHVPAYRDSLEMSRKLLRWQPETIVNLPEGIGLLPFLMPGSVALMQATVQALRDHRVVVWSKHGVMARSEISVSRAADRIEYAETAARYEYMNLVNHGAADALSDEEIRAIAQNFGVDQQTF